MIRSFHPRGLPQEVYPQLVEAGLFTPERIKRWEVHRECLCGCGAQVQALKKNRDGSARPERGFSYFTSRCWPRVALTYGLRGPNIKNLLADKKDPRYMESHRRGREESLMSYDDSRFFATLVEADCHERGMTFKDWARQAGLPDEWVNQIRRTVLCKRRPISKVSAAIILKILGEELPRDLKRALYNSTRPAAIKVLEYEPTPLDPVIDEVVIERLMNREPVKATREERREAVRRLNEQGLDLAQIGQKLGLAHNQVARCLGTLARREGKMAA